MQFNQGYYHSLDREYEMMNNLTSQRKTTKKLAEPLLKISEIGTSVAEGKEGGGRLRQTVLAAMHRGVREIELSMSPSNIGSGPASYSQKEREELREMAEINKVRFTSTHVSPGSIGNLSGMDMRAGRFSEQERQRQLTEIKEAITFAAETALGGAVVVHTGEFPRSISQYEKTQGFREFAGEAGKKERVHQFVDTRTGERVHTVREDQVNYEFYYRKNNGEKTKNSAEAEKDVWNKPILFQNPQTNNYETYAKTWENYEKEAETKQNQGEDITTERLFFNDTLKSAIEKAQSRAKEYESRYEEEQISSSNTVKRLKSFKDYYDQAPESQKLTVAEELNEKLFKHENIPPEKFVQRITEYQKNIAKRVESLREAVLSTNREIKELERRRDTTVPVGEYAKAKSMDSLAVLGIEAMRTTQDTKDKFSKKEVRDIFIAPENIFPAMGYGSHPNEMIELVEGSRDEMIKLLTTPQFEEKNELGETKITKNIYYQTGLSKEKAAKFAENHIKSTFDTEHLGMWKKHFMPKQGQSAQEYHEEFNKWYVNQVKKLADKNIIGHVHLADSFGTGHANLPPGQGILPIRDAVKVLKEKGYSGTLISEGFGDPAKQETDAWAYFGSPIYSSGGRTSRSFDQVHESYFMSRSPYTSVTPPYYPSEDWKMWSEVPLD